jgi:hypothetical protein
VSSNPSQRKMLLQVRGSYSFLYIFKILRTLIRCKRKSLSQNFRRRGNLHPSPRVRGNVWAVLVAKLERGYL